MVNNKKEKMLYTFYIFFPPLFHTILYFLSKYVEREPYNITTSIDNKIPFIAWFIVFYCIWYLLLLAVPLIIYKYDKKILKRYAYTYLLCSIISCFIYIAWPTTFNRPIIESKGLFNYIVKWIYSNDIPVVNCFPSFHGVLSFMWLIYVGLNKNISKIIRFIISFISIGVVLSTMFVKQHSYIDLIGAFILVIFAYYIVYKFEKRNT